MRLRPERLDIPDRRPYVRVGFEAGPSVVVRVPGLDEAPALRTRYTSALLGLRASMVEAQAHMLAIRPREEWPAEPPDLVARLTAVSEAWTPEAAEEAATALVDAQTAVAVACGYLLMRVWSDPDMALDTREAFDACKRERRPYESPTHPDPSMALGLDAYAELVDAGWAPNDIRAICAEVANLLTSWMDADVTSEVERKAKVFRGTGSPSLMLTSDGGTGSTSAA